MVRDVSSGFNFRSCFEFLQKVFLGLMYPFSCVLWAIFWSFPLLSVTQGCKSVFSITPDYTSGMTSKTLVFSQYNCIVCKIINLTA